MRPRSRRRAERRCRNVLRRAGELAAQSPGKPASPLAVSDGLVSPGSLAQLAARAAWRGEAALVLGPWRQSRYGATVASNMRAIGSRTVRATHVNMRRRGGAGT